MRVAILIFLLSSIARALSAVPVCHNPGKFINFMEELFCKPLSVGSSQVVSDDSTRRYFKLTRSAETEFKIELSVDFYPEIGVSLNMALPEVSSRYREGVNKCLALAADVMKGPSSERVKIQLLDPKEVRDIKSQYIGINTKGFRSNSASYEQDIDCATVVHEVLHLLGLQDEYAEKSVGYIVDPETGSETFVEDRAAKRSYDCRSLGPVDSVMNNHHTAFRSVYPIEEIESYFCKCDSSEEMCNSVLRDLIAKPLYMNSLKECPAGFQKQKGYTVAPIVPYAPNEAQTSYLSSTMPIEITMPVANQNAGMSMGMIGSGFGSIFPLKALEVRKAEEPRRNSILYPAHFRMLTMPLCKKENAIYLQCSKTAYVTANMQFRNLNCDGDSQCEEKLRSVDPETGCPRRPLICYTPDWLN